MARIGAATVPGDLGRRPAMNLDEQTDLSDAA